MNNMDQLEKQLECWIPRRPSARVKQQIFAEVKYAQYRPPVQLPGWFPAAVAASVLVMAALFWGAQDASQRSISNGGSSNVLTTLSLLCSATNAGLPPAQASAMFMDLTRSTSSISAAVLNRLQAAADYSSYEHRAPLRNVWWGSRFEWTMASLSLSTTGSFWTGRTNVRSL
jgi:hypothetical protein